MTIHTESYFQPFLMETIQSKWENVVEYNLSESGVHPISTRQLIGADSTLLDNLLDSELGYPQTNGTPELRERIAALYSGATPQNLLVTVGAAEANFLATRTILNPGDEAVVILPNYMQVWGIAQNHGVAIHELYLRETESGWALDLEELNRQVTPQTKLIALCNPNNPTGYIFSQIEIDAIIAAADRVGAWILADEVYSGTERLTDQQTPSIYGQYDRVLAINSLSKAYGLPGLRTGWVVAPEETIEEIWRRHEYTTITITALASKLAAHALQPKTRQQLLHRTRNFVHNGYSIFQDWLDKHQDLFAHTPPQATAVAYVRYNLDIGSSEFTRRLRTEQSTLVIPGDHFGMDHYLRIGFGAPADYLYASLDRIQALIFDIQS